MNISMEELRQHIKENPTSKGQKEVGNILEFLRDRYLEEHPIQTEDIQTIQKEMDPYFECLDMDASNKLFLLVYSLCDQYQKAAFWEGMCIGLRLIESVRL